MVTHFDGESQSSPKRLPRKAIALTAALSLSAGALQFAAPSTADAAIYDGDSSSYSSNDQAKFANEVYFFDFGKLASGEERWDSWGKEAAENNEAEFYGKRIEDGDSYTYTSADGLPEGLEVKVTVNNVQPMHEEAKYPKGPKAGQTINDGIWARTVTWNDFFRPLDLNNPGSIDRDQKRSNEWFDADVLYPSQPGAMLQLSNYLDPSGFMDPGDPFASPHGQINQGYSFSLNVEGTLNGKPVDLDLLASDGESTGIKVEDHENPFNSHETLGKKGGVPENLQLTPNGEGGWVVVQDLVGKDGRYYFVDGDPHYPMDVPKDHDPYPQVKPDPSKVWTGQNGAPTYGWVDTELNENGGPWTAIPQSQPLLVSRSATQIDVELDNHYWGKTGSRQGVVAGIFLPTDQGDAPESYGEASHLLTNWENTGTPGDPNDKPDIEFNEGNRVGDKVADRDGGKNWTKDPEGATGDGEEDLSADPFTEAFSADGDRKVTIPATAEGSAVVAWVDLNQDGKFDEDERRVGTDNGDGTFTFDWSDATIACGDGPIDTYVRVRVGADGVTADDMNSPTVTVLGGEVEDLKITIDRTCESVSVGDFVWFDSNGDGIQDEGEQGLAGVELALTGPTGEAVTDVNGNPVENVTTGEDGKYSFGNLPVLKDGESYTVTVVSTPEGYAPTKAEQGDDTAKDSSTESAKSVSLVNHGDEDLTLDFGFVKESVSVGDFVWFDANGDGIQDEGEQGLAGVELALTGPTGEAVTDVNGNPVENVTTGEDGKYSFGNLPVLKDGESYTVTVVKVPEGYEPTKAEQGDDRAVDSSTDSAKSVSLVNHGDEDLTLDFGFVKTESGEPSQPPATPIEPTETDAPATTPTEGPDAGSSDADNNGVGLATTGATGGWIVGAALALILAGLGVMLRRRREA